jgi:superfamily II DNA or RNA helicase
VKHALLRRFGTALEVSRDGRVPLSARAYGLLTREMTYTHVTRLYGAAAVDPITGDRRRVVAESVALFRHDPAGKLVCGAGYTDRVYHTLTRDGFAVDYLDITPGRPGPPRLLADWPRLLKRYQFRVAQRAIMEAVAARIDRGLGGVVQVPPGVGKSHLFSAYGLLYPKARIAITAPDIDNCQKTQAHMMASLPSVGMVGGGQQEQRRVTVYTLGSLHRCPDDVDLLLVDEAHKYMAERASAVLGAVAHRALRVAFTATPRGRIDGADAKMECLFGPVVYQMTWPEAQALGLIVPIEVRWIDGESDSNPCGTHSGIFKKKYGVWRNQDRNGRIAAVARTHPDDQVLIMVASIEHAVHLKKLLPEFELCYGTHDVDRFKKYEREGLIGADFVPVDPVRRELLRLDFEAGTLKKVIATDVWSTGVSFEALAVLIRGDARSSPILDEQIPGRVSRIHGPSGKAAGILYDCSDEFDRGLQLGAMARGRNYKERGWTQRKIGRPVQGLLFSG